MQRIESSDNKKLKRLTSLKQKKVRLQENLFLIEGDKSVGEAVTENAKIDMILISDSFLLKNSEYCKSLEDRDYPIYLTNNINFARCSGVKTPQGILAAIFKPSYTLQLIIEKKKPIVILDGISDPGNLGTIIRAADAFGFGGVLLLPGCADVYSAKTVQSTMGSVLRTACIEIETSDIDTIKKSGFCIYGMVLDGTNISKELFTEDIPAVVIGSESHGLKDKTIEKCSRLLTINMSGSAESLNAAVASGIVMHRIFEAVSHHWG